MNTKALLDRWRGGKAKLWEYTVSHKMLTIRVEFEGRPGNLHIYCGDLSHISGPTDWIGAEFEMEAITPDHLVLRDKQAGFEVHAGLLDIAENCKPTY